MVFITAKGQKALSWVSEKIRENSQFLSGPLLQIILDKTS